MKTIRRGALVALTCTAASLWSHEASAQSFNDALVQTPTINGPSIASIAGALSKQAFGPGDLARGVQSLPSGIDHPEERGGPDLMFAPSYSPESGQSEWGMGWSNELSIRRYRFVGDLDYATDEVTSPWGQLKPGSDGYWYTLGFRDRLRFTQTSAGWVVESGDGTRYEFFERLDRTLGTYAWYLTRVEGYRGDRADYAWTVAPSGARFLSTVTYGGSGHQDEQQVRLIYETIPVPYVSYASGEATLLDRRVARVEAYSRHAQTRAYALRWTHALDYVHSPMGRAFYLESITKTYAGGAGEPPRTFTYDFGDQTIDDAEFVRADGIEGYLAAAGGAALQPTYSATLDVEEDGRVDFEHHFAFALVHQTDDGWRSEPLAPNAQADQRCRPDDSLYNTPRVLARMRASETEPQVVYAQRIPSTNVTTILLCDRDGTPLHEADVPGVWELDATTRLVDVDRDRQPDFVRLTHGSVEVLHNRSETGGWSFEDGVTTALSPAFVPDTAWIHDINGDGLVDLVGRHPGALVVWYGRGNLQFEPQGVPLSFVTRSGTPLGGLSGFGASFLDANRDGLTDVLLWHSSAAFLFINFGDHFLERVIPALNGVGINTSNPVVADIRGSGEVELVYVSGGQAWALPLSSASTGLMVQADDGRGNRMRFGYGYAHAHPEVPRRRVVLTEVVSESGGYDAVAHQYVYDGPVAHSVGRQVIGFDLVRAVGPRSTEELSYVHEDDVPGIVVRSQTFDPSTPDLVRYTAHEHDLRSHLGVRWRRSRLTRTGWEDVTSGAVVEETSEVMAHQREWCPVDVSSTSRHGTLTETRDLAMAVGLVDALHCMPSRVSLTGSHADASLDFTESQTITRNARGLVTRVERTGSQGPLVQQDISYDALDRVKSVSAPGRGTTKIDYDPATGIVVGTTAPDGVATNIVDFDPVTTNIRAIEIDRGSGARFTTHFAYDGYERLERSWDDFGGSTQATPTERFAYTWPTATSVGVVEIERLVDGAAGITQRTAQLIAADGASLVDVTEIPQGWAVSGLSQRDRTLGIDKTLVRDPIAPGGLSTLLYGDLYVGAELVASTRTAGFGHAAEHSVVTQGTNVEHIETSLAIVGDRLVRSFEENGSHISKIVEDAAGRVLIRTDELGNDTRASYDAQGRIVGVTLADGTDHRIRYDDYGRGKEVKRVGVAGVSYVYDATTGILAHKRHLDATGTLARTVDYTVDAIGRVVREQHVDVATGARVPYEFIYDGGSTGAPGQRGYVTEVHGTGFQRKTLRNPDGTTRLVSMTVGGWREVEVVSTYYENGDLATTTRTVRDTATGYGLEKVDQAYTYDAYGRLAAVDIGGARAFELYYDAEGRMYRADFGAGRDLVFSFDATTREPNGFWLDAGAQVSGVGWYVDDRGHVREEVTTVGTDRRVLDYRYDARGFLEEVNGAGAPERYHYDETGLIDMLEDAAGRRVLTRQGSTLQAGGSTYRFDASGRIIERDGITLTYGPHGHVERAVVPRVGGGADILRFEYDENGERILKTRNGVPEAAYLFGGHLDGATFVEPVRLAGRLIGVVEHGRFELVHTDARGSLLADRLGVQNDVAAYGQRSSRPASFAAFDYVEHGYDADLGVIRFGSRDYDPHLGRFWTPDPKLFEQLDACAARPAECNLYGYAANNPIAAYDMTGHASEAAQFIGGYVTRALQHVAHDPMTYLTLPGPIGPIAMPIVQAIVPTPTRALDQDPDAGTLERLLPTNQTAASLVAAQTSTGFEQGKHAADVLSGVKETIELATMIRGLASLARRGSATLRNVATKLREGCFEAGTVVATSTGPVPIEEIRVGDRVMTYGGESATSVDETWWVADLTSLRADDGAVFTVLRPQAWLAAFGIEDVGDVVEVELDDLSFEGHVSVTELRRARPVSGRTGRVVLTTVRRRSDELYELEFGGEHENLRATGSHPLYSLDRNSWVAVRDLMVGELLQTERGALRIGSMERVRGTHSVFNLEVEGDHEYLVGADGIRAHNTCFPRKTLRGVSLKWLERNKPRGWRKVRTRDKEGWIWMDKSGTERLRYMRPNGKNPANSQWSRQSNGYFRWKNQAGEFLDADGNVVPKAHPDFHGRTHIPYEGLP